MILLSYDVLYKLVDFQQILSFQVLIISFSFTFLKYI